MRDKQRFHASSRRDPAREDHAALDAGLVAAAGLLTPSMEAIGREAAALLQQSLDALTEEHREVITMARIVKLPHAVIAEVMGRSEAAVRQLLVRALHKLTEELQSRGVRLDDDRN